MRCTECGAEVNDGAHFCPICHARIGSVGFGKRSGAPRESVEKAPAKPSGIHLSSPGKRLSSPAAKKPEPVKAETYKPEPVKSVPDPHSYDEDATMSAKHYGIIAHSDYSTPPVDPYVKGAVASFDAYGEESGDSAPESYYAPKKVSYHDAPGKHVPPASGGRSRDGYGGSGGSGGYGGSGGSGGPSYGRALPTDRSLLKYILLTIITCGIYSLFFFHSWAEDVNTACEGDGKSTAGLLKYILLTMVTCGIYAILWDYSLGNRLAENARHYGTHFQEDGTTVLMWQIFGILLCGIGPFIAMNILIQNTNRICQAYNEAHGY